MPTNRAKTIKFIILAVCIAMLMMMAACGKQSSSVSGRITYGGLPLAGIQVSLSGSGTATTDANGQYTFSDLSDGTYTITPDPSKNTNYTFFPFIRTAYLTQTDAGGFDFAAVCPNKASASQHTLFVKVDGTVWAWGNNNCGQLGNGTGPPLVPFSTTPVPTGLTNVIAVAAGSNFSLALKSDGTVWAWGNNDNGRLGVNDTTQRSAPVQVTALDNVVAISAGGGHAAAVKSDKSIWVWGLNADGQLGLNDTADRLSPVRITSLANHIIAVSAGYNHTLALQSDGQVLAWGGNDKGQLGDGTLTNRPAPIATGVVSALQVSAGNRFSAALTFSTSFYNGTVTTWGANSLGQLGIGTTSDYNASPTMINNFTNIAFVSAGADHTVALKKDGTVWAWGGNEKGQLGNGASGAGAYSFNPVQSISDSAAFANIWTLSAGNQDTIAYKTDRTVWGWGTNDKGQLTGAAADPQPKALLIQ